MILFIGVLPLLNALIDFASFGATRFFLRRGLQGNALVWAAADIAVALALLSILGGTFIAFIHHVRPQDGVALLDLAQLFETLSNPATRGQYWWLLVMLFSVVVPTGLHLALGLFIGLTGIVRRMGKTLGPWLEGSPTARLNARGILAALAAFSISFALWLIWTLILASPLALDLDDRVFPVVCTSDRRDPRWHRHLRNALRMLYGHFTGALRM